MRNMVRDKHTGQYVKTRLTYWTLETWDDGFVDPKGYVRVYRPDHPRASQAGWVHRHQVVWWLHTGSLPPEGYDIHHKDGNKQHDALSNLVLMEHGIHTFHHQAKDPVECLCVGCGDKFFEPQWRLNEGRGKYCSQECYHSVRAVAKERGTSLVDCVCVRCGVTFAVSQGRTNQGKNKYCSTACYHSVPKSETTRQRIRMSLLALGAR